MLTDEYYRKLFTEPLEINTPEKAEKFIKALEKAKEIAEAEGHGDTKDNSSDIDTTTKLPNNWKEWFISKGSNGARLSNTTSKIR